MQLRMGFVVPGFSLDNYNEAEYRFARISNQDIVRLEDEHALKIQEDAKVASTRRGKREHDLRRKLAAFLGHPSTQKDVRGGSGALRPGCDSHLAHTKVVITRDD